MATDTAELAQEMFAACGKNPDYIRTIKMVDNFLPSFDMNEQIATASAKRIEEHLAKIKAEIAAKVRKIDHVTDTDRATHQEFLSRIGGNPDAAFRDIFTVSEKCIGCGVCMKVCPGGCIKVEAQKAVYEGGSCQTCMACIHHCPQKAIGLRMLEKNPKARYHNDHILLTELVAANDQHRQGIS